MPLTDARIRGLKPRERPFKAADVDGLHILTKPTGARLWRFKYRFDRKEKVLAIGSYPEVSLAQARKTRDEARADVAAGVDPSEAKQVARRLRRAASEHSFARLADVLLEKSRKEGRAKSTLTKAEWLLDMAKAEFGRKGGPAGPSWPVGPAARDRQDREGHSSQHDDGGCGRNAPRQGHSALVFAALGKPAPGRAKDQGDLETDDAQDERTVEVFRVQHGGFCP